MIAYIGDYMSKNQPCEFWIFFFSFYLAVYIEKITIKIFQMKSLALHIANQKLSFDIFTVGNLLNIFMEHDLYLIS